MKSNKNISGEVTSIEQNGVTCNVQWNTPRVRDGKVGASYPTLALDKLVPTDADKFLGAYTTGTDKGSSIMLDFAQATMDRNAKAAMAGKGVGSDRVSQSAKLESYLASLPTGAKESETASLKKSMLSMADLVKRMMALSVETATMPASHTDKATKQAELAALTAELSAMTSKLG